MCVGGKECRVCVWELWRRGRIDFSFQRDWMFCLPFATRPSWWSLRLLPDDQAKSLRPLYMILYDSGDAKCRAPTAT